MKHKFTHDHVTDRNGEADTKYLIITIWSAPNI